MSRGFLDGYETYDTSNGRGNPREWRKAFARRMSPAEARSIMGEDDPYETLGVSRGASSTEVKSAYRRMARLCHPDFQHVHGLGKQEATKRFQLLTAAYTLLAS